MSRRVLNLEWSRFEALRQRMLDFGECAGQIVDEVLHGEGAETIKYNIALLLPKSGRTWHGKVAPASAAGESLFRQYDKPLKVTVATAYKYNYLYFPDDGSNTRRHVGNQQFMLRGAEAATDEVVAQCINALLTRLE